MTESITIYGFGDRDRSGKVRWLAEELGLSVAEERVKFGDHRCAPYTEINPLAQIPTVVFRGETLIESTAACSFVAEAVDEPKLWIGPREEGRQAYLFWVSAFAESLEGRLVECAVSRAKILDPRFLELHGPRVQPKLNTLAAMLPAEGYLCGEGFTLADITAGYSLRLALSARLIEANQVEPYLGRLRARPAAVASRFFDSLDR